MVGRRCETCTHPRARDIDAALRGSATCAEVARTYGLTDDAMERHARKHLDRSPRQAPSPVKRRRLTVSPQRAVELPPPPQKEVEPPQPQPATVELPLTPPQQKTKFLEVLGEYGSIARACRDTCIPRSRVHKWLEVDELFGFAYNQALVAATEGLEEVARERATRGARLERHVYRHGSLVETVVEYRPSDTALITLLKAQKPDTYRERIDQNVAGAVEVRYTNDWRAHVGNTT